MCLMNKLVCIGLNKMYFSNDQSMQEIYFNKIDTHFQHVMMQV